MIRRDLALARLVVAAFLLPTGLGADSAKTAAEYARLVKEYRMGNGDDAIRQLLTWEPALVAAAMRDAALPRREHESGQPIIEPGSFPAAIMLHTEAGLRLAYEGKGVEAAFQWFVAERIALAPYGLERPAFLRAWYHALGQYFLGSRNDDAIALLEQGRTQFPDDPSIALSLGPAYEARGTFSGGRMSSAWADRSGDERLSLAKAEGIYRSVLAVDATCTEARLRLGRVLQFNQQPEAGLVELRRVTAAAATPARLRYLAHLFIGDQLLHLGAGADESEAAQELERALQAWPAGQAAALSLARILHSQGRRGEAAQVLEGAITAKALDGEDPFRTYHSGDRMQERPLLEKVKAMAQDQQ